MFDSVEVQQSKKPPIKITEDQLWGLMQVAVEATALKGQVQTVFGMSQTAIESLVTTIASNNRDAMPFALRSRFKFK